MRITPRSHGATFSQRGVSCPNEESEHTYRSHNCFGSLLQENIGHCAILQPFPLLSSSTIGLAALRWILRTEGRVTKLACGSADVYSVASQPSGDFNEFALCYFRTQSEVNQQLSSIFTYNGAINPPIRRFRHPERRLEQGWRQAVLSLPEQQGRSDPRIKCRSQPRLWLLEVLEAIWCALLRRWRPPRRPSQRHGQRQQDPHHRPFRSHPA